MFHVILLLRIFLTSHFACFLISHLTPTCEQKQWKQEFFQNLCNLFVSPHLYNLWNIWLNKWKVKLHKRLRYIVLLICWLSPSYLGLGKRCFFPHCTLVAWNEYHDKWGFSMAKMWFLMKWSVFIILDLLFPSWNHSGKKLYSEKWSFIWTEASAQKNYFFGYIQRIHHTKSIKQKFSYLDVVVFCWSSQWDSQCSGTLHSVPHQHGWQIQVHVYLHRLYTYCKFFFPNCMRTLYII